MAVPTNTVQQDGIGTITADMYNTFMQGAAGLNGLSGFGTGGLQNFVGVSGMMTFVPGITSINDGNQGAFYWNASGSSNDGINNIQPNGVSVGCWTRIPLATASSGPINFTNAANFASGGNVASASTTPIGAAPGNNVTITGTTTITAFDTIQAGTWREVTFAGVLTLTYNAASLIVPTQANIVTAANDTSGWLSLGGGNWICMWYQRASGQALVSPSGAFNQITAQIFSISGTYTPTSGMLFCIVEIVGGGGGGGGCATTSSNAAAASGGGAGAYAKVLFSASALGASQTVTIGTGGVGGAAGNNNGNSGNTSSFGAFISCPGGAFGTGSPAGTSVAIIGAGFVSAPTISGGTTIISAQGTQGGYGMVLSASVAVGGAGAEGPFNSVAAFQVSTSTASNAGVRGGGGAGAVNNNGSAIAGGNGGNGYCIITEFIG